MSPVHARSVGSVSDPAMNCVAADDSPAQAERNSAKEA